jgi:hypothetical protein
MADRKVLNEADFQLLSGHLAIDWRRNFTVRKHANSQRLDIFLIQISFILNQAHFRMPCVQPF